MPYEVIARKWRPQLFEDVIGQDHITQTLTNAIKSDRLAHAYLFSGARGVGKTSVARIFAKAINCENGEPGTPCNSCRSCLEITSGSSVDVQEIDGASNRGIDEIRDLRDTVRYTPASSKYRIYTIDEVHMLTLPAFNALLKTLEEPPAHVKFIFATTEPQKVPATILSRCQRFDFKRIPLVQIVSLLEKIAAKEHFEIAREDLALIGREAEGSMRDAESLLDQVISFTGPSVDNAQLVEILGIIDHEVLFSASRAIIEGTPHVCLELIEHIYNYGYDIKEFYRALMDQFRNLLITLIAPENHLLDLSESELQEVKHQAEMAGSKKLQAIVNFLINHEERLRFTAHPRLVLETVLIKLCQLGDVLSFDELIMKIDALEKRLLSSSISTDSMNTTNMNGPASLETQLKKNTRETDLQSNAQNDKNWDGFLKFLMSKSILMYNVLKDWKKIQIEGNVLELTNGGKTFSSHYFDDKDRYAQLLKHVSDFFGDSIELRIKKSGSAPTANGFESNIGQSPLENKADNVLPPPVQEIIHMFQGKIKEDPDKIPAKENNRNKGPRPTVEAFSKENA